MANPEKSGDAKLRTLVRRSLGEGGKGRRAAEENGEYGMYLRTSMAIPLW